MVKRIILSCAAIAASLPSLFAGNDGKINLSLGEIAGELPDGILNERLAPFRWSNKDVLVLKANDSSYATYDIRSGKMGEYLIPESKMGPAIIRELEKTVENPVFSPDSSKIAYTKGNDLYVMDVRTGESKAISTDGTELVLNGRASWVYYEEILGRATNYKAFWWSPDSRKIAYYRFDDSQVPVFPIFDNSGKHGKLIETRYPMAGDENPKVKVAMADVESGDIVWADFDEAEDQYFGIPFWSADSEKFMVPWMPRDQNHLCLYEVSPYDGSKRAIYEERQPSWIDWIKDMLFTDDGFFMVRDFEGWEYIYYQSFDGKILKRLTDGTPWGTRLLKYDEKGGNLFYTSRAETSTRNDVYKLILKSGKSYRLSFGDYNFTDVKISPDNRYFAACMSNVHVPEKTVVVKISNGDKKDYEVVSDMKGENYDKYKIAESDMVFIEVDGYRLPASIILPVDMDSTAKYPVIISMYGGPNHGTVMDKWARPSIKNQLWANQGVIQVNIDHRASGHCGKKGLNHIYRNLGKTELSDYIEWVKYLRTLPYVDAERIGITGFSYGGTMTVLALTDGADYFQYGIAGGGVYDWQLYDSHYTERYMDTPQDNPEGYAYTRVCDRVGKYRCENGSMLRITHGSSDDNVHMQSTMQLIDALQKENKDFELMIYPGGMHGYHGYQAAHSDKEDLRFWYKYLLGQELPEELK